MKTLSNTDLPLLIEFEPLQPSSTLCVCSNKFDLSPLRQQLSLRKEETFGFVIIDASSCLFGSLCGNARTTLSKITTDIPKKSSQGSSNSIEKIRQDKKSDFVQKICSTALRLFSPKGTPIVTALCIGATSDFRERAREALATSGLPVAAVFELSYGGENGFAHTLELAGHSLLQSLGFQRQRQMLAAFFEHLARDSGRACYGKFHVMYALQEAMCVETILVWEGLQMVRCVRENGITREKSVVLMDSKQKEKKSKGKKEENDEWKILEESLLLEWLLENSNRFGASVVVVSDSSQEGSQFCSGFGGFGAILRFPFDFSELEENQKENQKEENQEDDENNDSILDDIEFF